MTPEEVEDYIKAIRVKTTQGYYVDDLNSVYTALWHSDLNGANSIFEVIKRHSDGDSESYYSQENRYMIIKFNGQFFKKTGYSDSWEGEDRWDGQLVEVMPYEIVTVEYKEKR